jgi:Flp pilus assembly protein TadD
VLTDDLEAGKQLAAKGDHAGAIKRFTAYLEKAPGSFGALLGRGISYYQIREYQKASDDLRRAAKLDDNSPEPHIWLARVLCAEGLPASASFREYEARRRGGVIESPCPPKK